MLPALIQQRGLLRGQSRHGDFQAIAAGLLEAGKKLAQFLAGHAIGLRVGQHRRASCGMDIRNGLMQRTPGRCHKRGLALLEVTVKGMSLVAHPARLFQKPGKQGATRGIGACQLAGAFIGIGQRGSPVQTTAYLPGTIDPCGLLGSHPFLQLGAIGIQP